LIVVNCAVADRHTNRNPQTSHQTRSSLLTYNHLAAIWVIEPKKSSYYLYSSGQLTPTAIFELPGTTFNVAMSEIPAVVD
jgi:predicted flavoprotein YhiN